MKLVSNAKQELFISSPFVNMAGVKILAGSVSARDSVQLTLLTSLTPQNIIEGVTEPSALLELFQQFTRVKVSSLSKLHAKVYLVDRRFGIITSANLTGGGLVGNFEYGVLLTDADAVAAIRKDMTQYYSLGNILVEEVLRKVREESVRLRSIQRKAANVVNKTNLKELLGQAENDIEYELLRNRLRGGRTINAIFADTILHILEKKGPLSTREINPFVQAIHPDICDDSIDRVINGEHFGKKWKHMVRNSQQYLLRKGFIRLKGDKWYLSRENRNTG